MVYLLIIFPKMVGKSESGKTEEKEETTTGTDSNKGSSSGIIGGVAGDILAGKYTL